MISLRSLSAAMPVINLLAGNLLGAFVGAAFFLYASWNFGLAEMGRYSVAISIQWVAVGLLGSGLSTAALRLTAGQLQQNNRSLAASIIYAALAIVVFVGIVVVALLLMVDGFLAGAGYLSGRLLALVALWVVARAVLDITRSALLAQQRYTDSARLTVLSALTGASALFAIIQLGELTLERLLVAHVVGLGSAAIAGLLFLKDLGRPCWTNVPALWPDLLRYARWPATSEGSGMLQANMGPLLLLPLAGAEAAGLFGVARYPAYLFEVVAVSLYQYWLPETSIRENHSNLGGYLRLQLLLASAIGLAMVLGAIVCSPFLPLLGENFTGAPPLFVLNAVYISLFLLTRPIDSVFHALRKPYLELWHRLVSIPLLIVAAWLLVPQGGALGMVWAHVITGFIALGFAGWLVRRALRRR